MINVAHGISFFIDLGLSGWPYEPERAANRPLGGYSRQLVARVNGTRTATDLLSVQRTLGSREQGAEKRPMPHPAHLRNRHNEEEGKVFVGRHLNILRLDQDPHSIVLPKKKG